MSSDRGKAWTAEETRDFIALWGDESIQSQLDGIHHNNKVYGNLSSLLAEKGHSQRTGKQCQDKLKKLRKKYRDILDHNNKSGRGLKTWEFYEAMDQILGSKPASRPAVLLQSLLGNTQSQQPEPEKVDDIDDIGILSDNPSDEELDITRSRLDVTESFEDVDENNLTSTPRNLKRNSSDGSTCTSNRDRKRKKNKTEKAINSAIEEFGNTLKNMDETFWKNEQKVRETQWQLTKDVEEMRQKREDQMRKEDREHEKEMFKMLIQAMGTSNNTNQQPRRTSTYIPPRQSGAYISHKESDNYKPPQQSDPQIPSFADFSTYSYY